tara:strand:- start:190 stop:1131 length:942 start_codon:yes stop_codon:yes gene_type:complete
MKIKIFIISLKKQGRIDKLKKIMKNLKLNFIIIKAIDGKKIEKEKTLGKFYDSRKTFLNIGRHLTAPEIGCAASHIKIYKYIVKKNIQQAIIMEDDAIPSKKIVDWLRKNIKADNDQIINFYSYQKGLLNKIPTKAFYNLTNIYSARTHLSGTAFYQINNFTCKKILKITGGKVISFADWPFNTIKHKINISVTLPFLGFIDDRGKSGLASGRNLVLKEQLHYIKNIFTPVILEFLRYPYYLLWFPFIFRKYKNFYFYFEHFFHKRLFQLLNIFTKEYHDLQKIFYDKNYYPRDLKKYVNKNKIINYEEKYRV